MIFVSYLIEQNGDEPVFIDESNYISRINEYDFKEEYLVFLVKSNVFSDAFGTKRCNPEMLLGADNINTMYIEIEDNHIGWDDTYYILNENLNTVYEIHAVNTTYEKWLKEISM